MSAAFLADCGGSGEIPASESAERSWSLVRWDILEGNNGDGNGDNPGNVRKLSKNDDFLFLGRSRWRHRDILL